MRKAILVLAVLATALVPAGAVGRARSVPKTLDRLAERGALSPEQHGAYTRTWKLARRAVKRLDGLEAINLDGVLDNASWLARRGMLSARLAPVFLTIDRNYQWFWTDRAAAATYGARRTFGGSQLIFQFYPGSGWQIQPLGNFGRLSALARLKRSDPTMLAGYADELLALAVRRKGFLAVEYYFPWAGGGPGWISGMATATGVGALARVWKRTADARYRDAAESMLGAFFTAPPWGVRLDRRGGRAHYLLYSQAPRLLVGNGFAQSLIGLDAFARITGSSNAALALERGLRQARAGIERYDTGDWSLYWRRPGTRSGGESNLHYHQLFNGFLTTLCRRFPDQPFCSVSERFTRYEAEPVRIGPLHARRHHRILRVRVWTSKPGTGTLTLLRQGKTVRTARLSLSRGTHIVRWPAPPRHRSYELHMNAGSLNGISNERTRKLTLR